MSENKAINKSTEADTLADVLSLVLDKGIVIAGDIQIKLADVDLLTIKIRLLVAGVDKAKEMGIDWWEHDSYLSSEAENEELEGERRKREELEKRIEDLEGKDSESEVKGS